MATRMHRSLAILVLLLPACGRTNCKDLADATDRDWCQVDAAAQAATDGDLGQALEHFDDIQDPLARTAAVDRIFLAAPPGLDQASARSLCGSLDEPMKSACLRSWNRPHLWGGTSHAAGSPP